MKEEGEEGIGESAKEGEGEGKREGEELELSINDIDEVLDEEETKPPSKPVSGSSTPTSGRRPINILLAAPAVSAPPANTPATPEKKSPSKSANGSATSVHIPEYLGQVGLPLSSTCITLTFIQSIHRTILTYFHKNLEL